MHDYRIFFLNDKGHVARPATIVECPDDEAALAQAQQFINGRAVEVWERARLVAHFDPIPSAKGR
jgi:hypothetical protein